MSVPKHDPSSAEAANPTFSQRMPALDGVRGIAILLVFFVHASPPLPGGRIGVDLFFALSGFLITSLLLQEFQRSGTIHIGRFYLRRALRLLPALFLVVSAVLLYVRIFGSPDDVATTVRSAIQVAFYVFNWQLVYDLPHHQFMFSHLWSLSVEEQFYIVWPLLTLGLLRLRTPIPVVLSIIAVAIIVPAVARIYFWAGDWRQALWMYFHTGLRADSLMWGALVAWILHLGPSRWIMGALRWAAPTGLIGLLIVSCYELLQNSFLYLGGFTLVGLLSALLIAGSALGAPAPFRQILQFGPLCWIGRISYGLYLWHWPVILFFMQRPMSTRDKMFVEMALTLAIATASFYGVERKFLRLKDRVGHAPTAGRLVPANYEGDLLVKSN